MPPRHCILPYNLYVSISIYYIVHYRTRARTRIVYIYTPEFSSTESTKAVDLYKLFGPVELINLQSSPEAAEYILSIDSHTIFRREYTLIYSAFSTTRYK